MVIIILLNGIHSELISYCQTAIKQIRLCILTVLRYFQFVFNFRACEKHWSGKWNINSKGSSSCAGSLFPPPLLTGRGVQEQRHCRTFWGLHFHSSSPAADLKSLFPDGDFSNCPKLNTLDPSPIITLLLRGSFHLLATEKTSTKRNYSPPPVVPLPPSNLWRQVGITAPHFGPQHTWATEPKHEVLTHHHKPSDSRSNESFRLTIISRFIQPPQVIETQKKSRKKNRKQHDFIFLRGSKYLRGTRETIFPQDKNDAKISVTKPKKPFGILFAVS